MLDLVGRATVPSCGVIVAHPSPGRPDQPRPRELRQTAFGSFMGCVAGALVFAIGASPLVCELSDAAALQVEIAAHGDVVGEVHQGHDHSDGPSHSDPCGDGCLCPCCPAHCLDGPTSFATLSAARRPPLPHFTPVASAPHASDYFARIFRPPRAC